MEQESDAPDSTPLHTDKEESISVGSWSDLFMCFEDPDGITLVRKSSIDFMKQEKTVVTVWYAQAKHSTCIKCPTIKKAKSILTHIGNQIN